MDPSESVELKIDSFVRGLRDAYLTLRRQTRKDSVGLGARYDTDLRRLAGQLMHRGGDPRSYMQFVFDQAAEHGSDISYPRIFFSGDMLNKYFLSRTKRREELEILANLQANQLENRLRNGRKMEDILRDPRVEFSALFRFVAAHQAGLTRLEEELRDDALVMLTYEPLYQEIYGKWLPEEVKCSLMRT